MDLLVLILILGLWLSACAVVVALCVVAGREPAPEIAFARGCEGRSHAAVSSPRRVPVH